MNLIITHAHCSDGWAAAFIAKKRYPEAEILPLNHGEPVPFEAVRGKDVLVVDFSWLNREDNIELHRIAKSFHIYDHHKTAQECLKGLKFTTFDMNRSGAGLVWDYLFGVNTIHTPETHSKLRPFYVNYVEDRDLWRHALPDSKAVSAYIMSLPMTIEAWNHLDIITAGEAAALGKGALSHVEHYVREAVNQAQYGILDFAGIRYSIAVVNALYLNCSEIGNVLAKQVDIGMTWFERPDGNIQFSLRSEGNIDVSVIAKFYFGGGHQHASGFQLSIKAGRLLIDSIFRR
jgi:oligoribonuclease NrnB/cAMP/cGMP phosphodiesterase (DHH superfamily)